MDFTRNLFYDIVVERKGFAFPVEVVYEHMPNFCTHWQNIGHDVTACQWLYPRKEKENNATKENVAQGKKPVPVKRQEWVPLKENPSSIRFSAAFQVQPTVVETFNVSPPQQQPHQVQTLAVETLTASPQQQQPREIVAAPIAVETTQVSPQQQQSRAYEVLVQNNNSTKDFLALEDNFKAN